MGWTLMHCEVDPIFLMRFWYSCIWSSYLDQETAKGPFRSSSQLPPVTTSLTTQRWRQFR